MPFLTFVDLFLISVTLGCFGCFLIWNDEAQVIHVASHVSIPAVISSSITGIFGHLILSFFLAIFYRFSTKINKITLNTSLSLITGFFMLLGVGFDFIFSHESHMHHIFFGNISNISFFDRVGLCICIGFFLIIQRFYIKKHLIKSIFGWQNQNLRSLILFFECFAVIILCDILGFLTASILLVLLPTFILNFVRNIDKSAIFTSFFALISSFFAYFISLKLDFYFSLVLILINIGFMCIFMLGRFIASKFIVFISLGLLISSCSYGETEMRKKRKYSDANYAMIASISAENLTGKKQKIQKNSDEIPDRPIQNPLARENFNAKVVEVHDEKQINPSLFVEKGKSGDAGNFAGPDFALDSQSLIKVENKQMLIPVKSVFRRVVLGEFSDSDSAKKVLNKAAKTANIKLEISEKNGAFIVQSASELPKSQAYKVANSLLYAGCLDVSVQ